MTTRQRSPVAVAAARAARVQQGPRGLPEREAARELRAARAPGEWEAPAVPLARPAQREPRARQELPARQAAETAARPTQGLTLRTPPENTPHRGPPSPRSRIPGSGHSCILTVSAPLNSEATAGFHEGRTRPGWRQRPLESSSRAQHERNGVRLGRCIPSLGNGTETIAARRSAALRSVRCFRRRLRARRARVRVCRAPERDPQ
jgi:hypothetical protein